MFGLFLLSKKNTKNTDLVKHFNAKTNCFSARIVFCNIANVQSGNVLLCGVCSPIDWPLCVQQLEDGFAIHLCRNIQSGHVQQSRCQVDV